MKKTKTTLNVDAVIALHHWTEVTLLRNILGFYFAIRAPHFDLSVT
jgi:hypothetical protein